MSTPTHMPGNQLDLRFPVSLGTYADYAVAQRIVDHLSDSGFPVQNCMIVGTDLKQVERVTGRLTKSKVAGAGALSGAWLGLLVGLLMSIFDQGGFITVLPAVLMGAAFGVTWALLGYSFTRGERDFTSVSRVVATRYEVLVEHSLLAQAQELMAAAGDLSLAGTATSSPSEPVHYAGPTGSTPDGTSGPGGSADGVGAPTAPVTPPSYRTYGEAQDAQKRAEEHPSGS